MANLEKSRELMRSLTITPSKAEKYGIKVAKDGISRSSEEILSRKNVNIDKIRKYGQKSLSLVVKLMNN